MKILLTSMGFDNPNLQTAFVDLLNKQPKSAKLLFIPTALKEHAEGYLPEFIKEMEAAGINRQNITVYNLDEALTPEDTTDYDVIYFGPGNPNYLLERIHAVNFEATIHAMLDAGCVYVGFSAGSDIAGNNLEGNLGLLDIEINTHAEVGSENCKLDVSKTKALKITNNQGILIIDDDVWVIE